jgi:hypothetical protein
MSTSNTIVATTITINTSMSKTYLKIYSFEDVYSFDSATSLPSGCTITANTFAIVNDPITTNNRKALMYNYTGSSSVMDGSATFTINVIKSMQSWFVDFYYYMWDYGNAYVDLMLDGILYLHINRDYIMTNLESRLNPDSKYKNQQWCRYIFPNLTTGTHTVQIRFYTSWTGSSGAMTGVSRIGKINETINLVDAIDIGVTAIQQTVNAIKAKAVTSLLIKQDLTGITIPSISCVSKQYSDPRLAIYITSNILPNLIIEHLNAIPASGARQVINAIQPPTAIQTFRVNSTTPSFFTTVHISVDSKTNPITTDICNPRFILNYLFSILDITQITSSSCHVTLSLDRIGEFDLEEFGVVYTYKDTLKTSDVRFSVPLYDTVVGMYTRDITKLQSDRDYIITAYVKLKNDPVIYFNEADSRTIYTPKRSGISLCLANITSTTMDVNIGDIPNNLIMSADFPLKFYLLINSSNNKESYVEYFPTSIYGSSLFENYIHVPLPKDIYPDISNNIYCDIRNCNNMSIWKFKSNFVIPPNIITTAPTLKLSYCYDNLVQLSWNSVPNATFYRLDMLTNNDSTITTVNLPNLKTTFETPNITGYTKFRVRACNSNCYSDYSNFIDYTPIAFYPTPVAKVIGSNVFCWNNVGTNHYEILCEMYDGEYIIYNVQDTNQYTIQYAYEKLISVKVRAVGIDANGDLNKLYSLYSNLIYV